MNLLDKKKHRDLFFQYFLLIIASFLGFNASQIMQQPDSQKTISVFIFCIMAGIICFITYFAVYIYPEELGKLIKKIRHKKNSRKNNP